jgi:hypothetical protein
MSEGGVELPRHPCGEKTTGGDYCCRLVPANAGRCWQQANTFRSKWRALTRNQSVLFVLAVVGVLLGLIAFVVMPGRKGFVQLGKIWFNVEELHANQQIPISVWINNYGGEPVHNVYHWFEVRIVRVGSDSDSSDRLMHQAFLSDALQAQSKSLSDGFQGLTIGKGEGVWTTMQIPPLSQDEVKEILNGRIRIYVYTWIRWRDAERDVDLCEWLQAPPTTKIENDKLIWHLCTPTPVVKPSAGK